MNYMNKLGMLFAVAVLFMGTLVLPVSAQDRREDRNDRRHWRQNRHHNKNWRKYRRHHRHHSNNIRRENRNQ